MFDKHIQRAHLFVQNKHIHVLDLLLVLKFEDNILGLCNGKFIGTIRYLYLWFFSSKQKNETEGTNL